MHSRPCTKIISLFLLVLCASNIASFNLVNGYTDAKITINTNNVIGSNSLSLGTMLDYEWYKYVIDNQLQQLSLNANIKLIRFWDFKPTNPPIMPCLSWNEATKTGTWDWRNVDRLVGEIYANGAEPLICLGSFSPAQIKNALPPGMTINALTRLPNPESYAAYCAEWVKHFKTTGVNVRFYELINEAHTYFGWSPNYTKLGYFTTVWNTVARAMRAANPNILLSFDFVTKQKVFDYWLVNGDRIDYLDFHKYDGATSDNSLLPDATIFSRAEKMFYQTYEGIYGLSAARQKWLAARGTQLPAICSEMNLNSIWKTGTDPRLQTMTGATWLALTLRQGILEGLNYCTYYTFGSYSQYSVEGKNGYGMIDLRNDLPWYPYYVYTFLGQNLGVGDKLIESSSTSADIRTISWIHGTKLMTLVISKTALQSRLVFDGLTGELDIQKIDSSIPWKTAQVRNEKIPSTGSMMVNGYTVMLIKSDIPTSSILEDSFETGTLTRWSGTTTTAGESVTVSTLKPYQGADHAIFTKQAGSGLEQSLIYKTVNDAKIVAKGYFYFAGGIPLVDNNDRLYLIRLLSGLDGVAAIGIKKESGVLNWNIFARNGADYAWVKPSAPPTITSGRWYSIELRWEKNLSTGKLQVYINSQLVASLSNINTSYFGNVSTVQFGIVHSVDNQGSMTVYGDQFLISNTY